MKNFPSEIEMIDDETKINRAAIDETIREGRFNSAEEELFVLQMKVRAARNTNPEVMSEDRLKLIGRLACALADLTQGHAGDAKVELANIEHLAKRVHEEERVHYNKNV